jgi:hypothetical protein
VRFTASLEVAASAERVWSALVDWPAHGRWVPLTTVRVLTPSGEGVGARFCGRTGVGPLAFDDPMEVVQWRPPRAGDAGFCRVVKQGRVVLGEAWFEVVPLAAGRCRADWTEVVEVVPVALTRPLRRLAEPLGRRAFVATLRRMRAQVEAGASDVGNVGPGEGTT